VRGKLEVGPLADTARTQCHVTGYHVIGCHLTQDAVSRHKMPRKRLPLTQDGHIIGCCHWLKLEVCPCTSKDAIGYCLPRHRML